MYAFSINKKMDYSAPILFVPYFTSHEVPKNKPLDTFTAQKPVTLTPQKTITAKSAVQNKTTITSIKNEIKKQETKKIAEPKKTEIKKAEIIEKKVVPVETPKPVVVEKKESSSAQASSFAKASSSVKTSADTSADMTADMQKNKVAKAIDVQKNVIPANARISHNFREVEALKRGAQLQKELVKQWHPPIGVSADCTCDISFFVNKQGTIENLKMVKSSGIIMFDVSARQALFSMKMPQWTYGKPLAINFSNANSI